MNPDSPKRIPSPKSIPQWIIVSTHIICTKNIKRFYKKPGRISIIMDDNDCVDIDTTDVELTWNALQQLFLQGTEYGQPTKIN